jgi:formate dehydrogenase iron-sulfur subunit
MHCLEPACASVCPVSALEKTPEGPVVYHANRCIGCRYCMMACPFRVPKYNWENPLPLIKKCTFCAERQAAGLEPACVEACPTDAIVFGRRDELIAEAHRRIQAEPEKYVDHVYGEHEAAGTSALYLSHVPFEKLGFPTLDAQPITARSEAIMSLAPAIFGGAVVLASGIYWLTGRRAKMDAPGEEGE